MAFKASVIICEDLRLEHDGKLTAVGIFTADLGIPNDPFFVPHLAALFVIHGDLPNIPDSLTIEIYPPQGEPIRSSVTTDRLRQLAIPEGRKQWRLVAPLAMGGILLRTGRLVCKVSDGKETIEAGGTWVQLAKPKSSTQE